MSLQSPSPSPSPSPSSASRQKPANRSATSPPPRPTPPLTSHRFPSSRLSRQQLLRHLEILGSLSAVLPPDLPPSPPASRAPSPAPLPKRKLDHDAGNDHIKRPRTSDVLDKPSRHQPSSSLSAQAQRSDPCEEGELRDDSVPSRPSRFGSSQSLPIQRPRRNLLKNDPVFEALHDRYYKLGRMLKYSGDTRFWSTFTPSHKEYRPLVNPPPVNSPYHQHGPLMARLELLDALICFTYAIWSRDYRIGACLGAWPTTEAYLDWTKRKWLAEINSAGEHEKAFVGLIYMIEGFIHSRVFYYRANQTVLPEIMNVMHKARPLVESAANDPPSGPAGGTATNSGTQVTPPMLPSPASIAPANSANSTPTGRGTGTPNPADKTASLSAAAASQRPPTPAPRNKVRFDVNTPPPSVANTITLPITASFAHSVAGVSNEIHKAAGAMRQSQHYLTLHVMAKHFPVTFARMIHSSLSQTDEFEPDMEDEEGELFWPGSPETGEGLGWVCLMGKAMIKEFGKEIGYLGYGGIVRKPEPSAGFSNAPPSNPQPPQQRR